MPSFLLLNVILTTFSLEELACLLLLLLHGPPLMASGKNVVASFLPFTSLNHLFQSNSRPLFALLEVASVNFLLVPHLT